MNLSKTQQSTLQKIELSKEKLPWFVNEFLDVKINKKRMLNTVYGYSLEILHFLKWICENNVINCSHPTEVTLKNFEDLNKKDVLQYLIFLENDERLLTNTINRKISSLRSLFTYLTVDYEDENGESYFNRNVMNYISLKKKNNKQIQANDLSRDLLYGNQIEEFLDFIIKDYEEELVTDRQRSYFLKTKARDLSIISLLLESGIRVSELISLKKSCIHLGEKIIVVNRKEEEIRIPISSTASFYITEYLNTRLKKQNIPNDIEFLFCSKYAGEYSNISIRSIQMIVQKYTSYFTKHLSPQKLRQSFAVHHWNLNKDATSLLNQMGNINASVLDVLTRIKYE